MCIYLSVFQAAQLHELRQYMCLFMYCIHLFISWHSLTSFNIHMHFCVCVRLFQLSYQYAFSSKIVSECYIHSYMYVYTYIYHMREIDRYIYIYTVYIVFHYPFQGTIPVDSWSRQSTLWSSKISNASDVASCGLVWMGKSHQHNQHPGQEIYKKNARQNKLLNISPDLIQCWCVPIQIVILGLPHFCPSSSV